jgi:uncharacterized protein YjbI with pentapeptide repeats
MANTQGQHPIAQQLAALQTQKQTQGTVQQPMQKKRALPTWTGFSEKTLWDWLKLLIIPALLAIVAIGFNTLLSEQQNATNIYLSQISNQQFSNQQQEATFQAYLDRMTDLIENGKLADPHSSSAIRALARAQTLTALRRLDPERKGHLIQFLHDAGLINNQHPILSLYRAFIERADLSNADLRNIDLSNANLRDANLRGAYLNGTSLVNTNLIDANLSNADLRGTYLKGAYLRGTIMPDGSRHP